MNEKPNSNVSRWTVASIAAAMLAIFVALEKWPGAEQFVVFWLQVIERIATDWKVIVSVPAVLFGGLCGVAYPWFMDADIAKALAERRLRVASALLTLLMGLIITWYLDRRIDGIIVSVICSVGGPMFSMAALHWLMVKLRIVPAALVPTRKEVDAIVCQMVAAEKPPELPIVIPSPNKDAQ